jgi:phospholipase/lecithinase/hemolysin
MARPWLRRALLLAASASALLLAACGSGTIESQLSPSRIIVFGDGMADIGQTGNRYTINDGSTNNWTLQLAAQFGMPLTTVAAGGTSYATGNARVVAEPDAAGSTATPTVKEQIDAFLAAGSFDANDLVVVNAGTADVVAEAFAYSTGAQTAAQMEADVVQAGTDLAAQVRRLVQAGARQVVVVGPYNLGRSAWAHEVTTLEGPLETASGRFNEALLVNIVDLGANVFYVDAALYFNLVTAGPGGYGFDNDENTACTSVDAGAGIGTGSGQVNSKLCTTATLLPGIDPETYVFADRVYFTPHANRLFGDYAYERIRTRW